MKGNRSLYSSLLLQTVIIMVYISTISTEIIQLQNDGAISADTALLANKNKVTTTDECKVMKPEKFNVILRIICSKSQ